MVEILAKKKKQEQKPWRNTEEGTSERGTTQERLTEVFLNPLMCFGILNSLDLER